MSFNIFFNFYFASLPLEGFHIQFPLMALGIKVIVQKAGLKVVKNSSESTCVGWKEGWVKEETEFGETSAYTLCLFNLHQEHCEEPAFWMRTVMLSLRQTRKENKQHIPLH